MDLFIWETHGIHVGTGNDHVKHGLDDIEAGIEKAINLGFPSITFIIHTPRLTNIRYRAERDTKIKFIRGDDAYFQYVSKMQEIKEKYEEKIDVIYGLELEWLGSELGLHWNRAKILQAPNIDFIVGSVHFSKEGLPYDGSKSETQKLIKLRGGIEKYWEGYIDDMSEMITTFGNTIQVVGHIDLLKLYAPYPEIFEQLRDFSTILGRKYNALLELISSYNLALDLNLAGLRKKCGIYPDIELLKKANRLNIPITIGTDAHNLRDIGTNYEDAIEYLKEANYRSYISFSGKIPKHRPFKIDKEILKRYNLLNIGTKIINERLPKGRNIGNLTLSFGGSYSSLLDDFSKSISLANYNAIRVRKQEKIVTLGNKLPEEEIDFITTKNRVLYSHHKDTPGVLSIIFNTLASEGINVESTYLRTLNDGTATAYITLSDSRKTDIKEAIEFIKGTGKDNFIEISYKKRRIPKLKKAKHYILGIDGVTLPIRVSNQMILTIHNNQPGVLLILLSILASYKINILDLQLGARGNNGYSVIAVKGDDKAIKEAINKLGDDFLEVSYFEN